MVLRGAGTGVAIVYRVRGIGVGSYPDIGAAWAGKFSIIVYTAIMYCVEQSLSTIRLLWPPNEEAARLHVHVPSTS